jgi:dATP pyrophosphohydrolase
MTSVEVRVIDCHIVRMENDIPQYLLLKRTNDVKYPGIWQCVTGKIEPNEKPFQTALRELNEETGLVPKSIWTIDVVNHFYEACEDRMNLIPVFGVEVESTSVTLSKEHCDLVWCEFEKAKSMLLWNQQKIGLEAFNSMLIQHDKRSLFTKISID